jgi:hypothetical protein
MYRFSHKAIVNYHDFKMSDKRELSTKMKENLNEVRRCIR